MSISRAQIPQQIKGFQPGGIVEEDLFEDYTTGTGLQPLDMEQFKVDDELLQAAMDQAYQMGRRNPDLSQVSTMPSPARVQEYTNILTNIAGTPQQPNLYDVASQVGASILAADPTEGAFRSLGRGLAQAGANRRKQQAEFENKGEGVYLGDGMQKILFAMLMIGFLVKLPAVPFHTWLPDAHVQAPTGGSMLLAGVMLKMGAYGMFRLPLALFPDALIFYQDLIMAIGLISLVWGAVVCLGQTNLKRMVAYSSVSHMGVILLGIASMQPIGYAAALFMMFAHGIISPMLFAVCGAFKHHYHSMEIGAMRGMAKWSPYLAVYMMFAWMASLGLPLLAGFVAELMVMIAFWPEYGWWILLPGAVLAITAAYYLWSMQRTIFEGGDEGQPPESLHGETPPDITLPENIGMIILAIFTVIFGIFPFIALGIMGDWTEVFFRAVLIGGGV